MKSTDRLRQQIDEIRTLVWIQYGARMGLRAAWLFGAGFLSGWGLQSLFGWPLNTSGWILIGACLGLLPLFGLGLRLARRQPWVWTLDRRLGFQEQISTAWEVAGSSPGSEDGFISQALVSQALAALPGIRRRILRRGWFLERDLLALLIVLLLAGLSYASVRLQSFGDRLQGPLAESQAIDPVDPFPELVSTEAPPQPAQPEPGSQGAQEQGGGPATPSDGPGSSDEPGDNPAGTSPNLDPEALAEALGELGADLSQQAPTYDLGQSLQDLDLEGAAGALDALRDQLDDLAPETRDALAEDLQEAAGEVEAAGEPNTADDLRDAAEALGEQGQAEEDTAAEESLDQLAEDLRALAEALQPSQANGSGAGGGGSSGQSGNPEPAGRLQGEGGELELPLEEDAAQSGLLSPASPDAAGSGTAAGSLDSVFSAGEDLASSPLVPNSFLWKWRDVVSSYFHR